MPKRRRGRKASSSVSGGAAGRVSRDNVGGSNGGSVVLEGFSAWEMNRPVRRRIDSKTALVAVKTRALAPDFSVCFFEISSLFPPFFYHTDAFCTLHAFFV